MSKLTPTVIFGRVIASNSTTTPLGAGGSFSGSNYFDVSQHGVVYITVYANVASATDGLLIVHSTDGTNIDHFDQFTVPAATGIPANGYQYSVIPASRYMRVFYTNGGVAQTTFRLQTLIKEDGLSTSSRLQNDISDDVCGITVKSTLAAIDANDAFINLSVTPSGSLNVTDAENGLSVSRGIVNNTTYVHSAGQAPDFDISDGYVDVWDGANDGGINQMVYQFSTTDDIDSLSSSNNGDTQDIEVIGLDGSWELTTQTITITGQTRKALDTDLVRVFSLRNVDSTDNAGDIYCFVNGSTTLGVPDTAADVRAVMRAGNNQTLMAIYTIPDAKKGYLRDWYVNGANATFDTTGISTVQLWSRPNGEVFQLKNVCTTTIEGKKYKYEEPELLEGRTDIKITVNTSIDASSIAAGFNLVLIDD
jgi:hypothetical protein